MCSRRCSDIKKLCLVSSKISIASSAAGVQTQRQPHARLFVVDVEVDVESDSDRPTSADHPRCLLVADCRYRQQRRRRRRLMQSVQLHGHLFCYTNVSPEKLVAHWHDYNSVNVASSRGSTGDARLSLRFSCDDNIRPQVTLYIRFQVESWLRQYGLDQNYSKYTGWLKKSATIKNHH